MPLLFPGAIPELDPDTMHADRLLAFDCARLTALSDDVMRMSFACSTHSTLGAMFKPVGTATSLDERWAPSQGVNWVWARVQ
jgi:hypothetical protein